jgi:hypothetical protein
MCSSAKRSFTMYPRSVRSNHRRGAISVRTLVIPVRIRQASNIVVSSFHVDAAHMGTNASICTSYLTLPLLCLIRARIALLGTSFLTTAMIWVVLEALRDITERCILAGLRKPEMAKKRRRWLSDILKNGVPLNAVYMANRFEVKCYADLYF